MAGERIIVADDDPEIVGLICETLEDEGFEVVKAYSGQAVLEADLQQIDLIILDIMMPGASGLEVCRSLRTGFAGPILFLSARDRVLDKIVGLEQGADDYMTKPFDPDELVARVKAHFRRENRRTEPASSVLSVGNLRIHKDTYEVYLGKEKVVLSTREFQVLLYLAQNMNVVLTREQIYTSVWGDTRYGELNSVTMYIKSLRDKLDPDETLIKTVWGVGYKLIGDVS